MNRPRRPAPRRGQRRGLQVFSVAGIPITIDPSWLIIFFLVAWSAGGLFRLWLPGESATLIYGMGGLAALLLFASVLLHELSHSLVALLKGLQVEGITLFIFGGVSHMSREADSPTDEIHIAGAGPLASFLLAGLFFGLYLATLPLAVAPVSAILLYLCMVNTALGVFNLIPAFPLDGGRVLRAWFWNNSRSLPRATISAARVGRFLAFTLMGLGALLAFTTGSFSGLWWVLIGLFLNRAATASAQRAVLQESLHGLKVHQVMTPDTRSLSPDQPLNLAFSQQLQTHPGGALPVVQEGRVLGLLSVRQLERYPQQRWPYLAVADAMTPLDDAGWTHPDEAVTPVLERMLASGQERLLVLDDSNRLLGVVSRRDIMAFLRSQPALRRATKAG
jgi:Zn-dependent protease/predicted transcriptional regulator